MRIVWVYIVKYMPNMRERRRHEHGQNRQRPHNCLSSVLSRLPHLRSWYENRASLEILRLRDERKSEALRRPVAPRVAQWDRPVPSNELAH